MTGLFAQFVYLS